MTDYLKTKPSGRVLNWTWLVIKKKNKKKKTKKKIKKSVSKFFPKLFTKILFFLLIKLVPNFNWVLATIKRISMLN